MKYSRFLLTFSLVASTSLSAMAASAVMVQFGSFETNDEAQKRLSAVKTTHAAALGSLPTSVREVKLPPDNLTVYRTQAGPLASRGDAQSLCSKLANAGDECYVVETAVQGNAVASAPAASPALPTAVAAVSMGNSTNGSALSSAPPIPSAPTSPVVASTNIAAGGPALAPLSSSTNSPDMQAALDRAAANENVSPNATPTVVQATEPKPGFWTRVNPFTSKPAAPVAVAAPVVATAATPDITPVAEPGATATPVVVASAVPVAASSVTYTPSSVPVSNSSIVMPSADDSRPHLLPPPAPLTSQDRQILETRQVNIVPPATPVASQPLQAPTSDAPFNTAAPLTQTAAAPALIAPQAGDGLVKVEEAKRVPLSEATVSPQVPSVTPAPAAISLLPSSTAGQKTLWAQIGQFKDVQSALTFWQHYRETHPDFPATRIRVASSLQQQYHGNDKMWLRVGPFAREGFIRNLCNSISQTQKGDNAQQTYQASNMRCGTVQDLGIAAQAGGTGTGYLSGSRYKR